MSETLLYLTAGIFYTVSLELFVLFMMTAFQALPGKIFFFRKINFARFFILAALFSGLAGGYICYMADGYFTPFQLWTAFFPALFVPFLIMGYFKGGSEKDDSVVLHMKAEYTKEEKRQRFHDMIMIAAAFFVPLPTAPMFLWYKKYGQGDNPYMVMMVMSLMIVVAGGCRRLFKNAKNGLSKIHYFIFNVMYYIVIATCFVRILMKIEEIMR